MDKESGLADDGEGWIRRVAWLMMGRMDQVSGLADDGEGWIRRVAWLMMGRDG